MERGASEADYEGNDAIKKHIQMKLFPPMSITKLFFPKAMTEMLLWILSGRKLKRRQKRRKLQWQIWQEFNLLHVCEEVHDEELSSLS